MSRHRLAITLVALLSAMVSLLGVTNVAHASPQVTLDATYGAPKEGAKVILDDTSIDGPAIAAMYPGTVLAWTGTDAKHHINLMTSSDGLHYGNKRILPETSLWRPALAYIPSMRGAPYGTIVLAWTGTDSQRTLNLELISTPDYRVTQKITFWGEKSFTAPAVAVLNSDFNSDIYLAWAGTDRGHTLNIIHRTTHPQSQDKRILRGWRSLSRPNLSTDLSSDSKGGLILSWTGANHALYFAYSAADKTHWTMASESPLAQQSAWAPSMIGFSTSSQPSHWLAWTGTGTVSARALNVEYTQHYPAWSDANAKTTLKEAAISGPALAYRSSPTGDQVLIGWTGVDRRHHLNVAVVTAPAGTGPIALGPRPCPTEQAAPAYWAPIVKTHSAGGSSTVERVQCASMMGAPSLQALVTARHADQTLDVYVFNNITAASPSLIFQLSGLVKGEAKVSGYSTVLTGEIDQHSSVNEGKPVSAMTTDLFREFAWSSAAGTMAQTAFPGIFPDLTRYQAEADQEAVNQGHQPWKLSATQVAITMAASLLQWPASGSTATVLSGGGPHDVDARIEVKNSAAPDADIKVALSRLEGNTNNGIWEVISVTADNLSITEPIPLSPVFSPVKVTGTGPAYEGVIGQVVLLDHLYTQLVQAKVTGAVGMGQTTFTTSLPFTSSFPEGMQEGVLILSTRSEATGAIAHAVMQKALVGGPST